MELFTYLLLMFFTTFVFYTWACYKQKVITGDKIAFFIIFLFLSVFFIIFYFSFRLIDTNGTDVVGGIDSIIYKERFENATGNLFVSLQEQTYEYGYGLFVYIIRIFTSSYVVFEIIYYLIIMVISFKVITMINLKANLMSYFLIFVFITIPLFESINIARHSLAYFIGMLAIAHMMKNNRKHAFIYSLIATSFHIAGFIILLIVFMNILKIKKNLAALIKDAILLAIVFVVGYFVLRTILSSTRYILYFNSDKASLPFGLIIERLLLLLSIFLFIDIKSIDKSSSMIIFLALSGLVISFLQLLLPILYRVNIFCGIGCFFVFNEENKCLKTSRVSSNKRALEVIIIGLLFVRLMSFTTNSIESQGLLPHYYLWQSFQ